MWGNSSMLPESLLVQLWGGERVCLSPSVQWYPRWLCLCPPEAATAE